MEDVVVLKLVIFICFNIVRMWVFLNKVIFNIFYFCGHGGIDRWFVTVSTYLGCGSPERRDFLQFWLVSVVVLKNWNSFYFLWVWWSWKKRFLTVSIFGRLVLRWCEWSWKNLFLTISTLGGCGGAERRDF